MSTYQNVPKGKSQHPYDPTEPQPPKGPPKHYGCDDHIPTVCEILPDFKRLNYFYGQMLGVADFQTEQNYFREKLKLHNRCLHGYGVICGLRVAPDPTAEPCSPESDQEIKEIQQKLRELERARKEVKQAADAGAQGAADRLKEIEAQIEEVRRKLEEIRVAQCDPQKPTRVIIDCGLALDCEGNELVVRHKLDVDIWRLLDRSNRNRVTDGEHTVYVTICYCQQPTDPTRAVLPDSCGATSECSYGKWRDSVKVHVSVDPPALDQRCATCCEPCCDPCLLLARIDDFYPGRPLEETDIHNEVRRPLTTYQFTTITGISWTDGAEYTEDEAEALLGVNPGNTPNTDPHWPRGYLLITFSRPIRTSTIKRGVIDVWMIQGGGGRKSDIFNLDVEYVDLPDPAQEETVDRIRFRVDTDESPNPGDRVLITVRGPRLLDECCLPVNAANTGGRTPFVDDEEFDDFRRENEFPECVYPPPFGYGPWTSGTNSPGPNFESWFYITANPRGQATKK